jgi:glycosyltransferase involved in cell wall biosynthesis
VCVNDASTEKGVVELLNELSKKYDIIKVINNEKNLGIGDTQNVAIKHAKGEYIAFLDCDDMLARK